MDRVQKIAAIRKAYNYNSHARNMASCNHLYMGSMATCMLFHVMGGDWPNETLDVVMERATDEQLDAGLQRCAGILEHAR